MIRIARTENFWFIFSFTAGRGKVHLRCSGT